MVASLRFARASVVPFLVAMAWSLPAMAGTPGSVELGGFGGYDVNPSDTELGNAKAREFVPESSAGIGLRLGYAVLDQLSVEVEGTWSFSSLAKTGESAPVLGLRAHALADLLTEGMFVPFVRLGVGSEILLTGSDKVLDKTDFDAAVIGGLGTRVILTDELFLRLDLLALGIPGQLGTKTISGEGWLGVSYVFGGAVKDADGDGISDRNDECPNSKEDVDGWQDQDGCPDLDNDGDGVNDGADKCPDKAETRNGCKDDDGCPDSDVDGDGVEDKDDACPNEAETKNGYKDDDGCPDDPDADGDGIPDSKDKCPKEKETVNGIDDLDGCPDQAADMDGDGVPDATDRCPRVKETVNGFEDQDGCPDKIPDRLKKFTGAIQGIVFESGSAKIVEKSFATLDAASAVLIEFKTARLEVSGHTDNTGSAELNTKLSLERAEAVKAYFVGKGIAADRITTVGNGPDKPMADNKTPEGRAKNRRIEFKLL
ncbi:MAG: OmpA family protein [Myxococcota bacterium]